MSYFGVSLRNGVGLGLGTVPSLTNTPLSYRLAPSLDLSFAGSDTLSPLITFSRTTNATVTGSNGLIQNAPMNLLTYSEQFDNAAWVKSNATVTANAVVSPDGTVDADKLIANTSSIEHLFRETLTLTAATHTLSVYAKAGEYSWVALTGVSFANAKASFNLSAGTVGTVSGSGSPVASISNAGNGWFRCVLTFTASAGSAAYGVAMANGNDSTFFAGNGTDGIYIWGAQLELGSTATTYNPTTVKNLLGYTEHFDNAAWTKSNASISATKVNDIYGQPFAQKLVEDTVTSAHRVSQGFTTTAAPYTFSVYLKAAERSFALIYTGTVNTGVMVNLSTGAVTTVAGINAPTTSTATEVGNGWYRCSITFTATAATNVMFVYAATSATTYSYTGDGTSGIYIFGAQLSDSASVDPYVYNPVAAPSAAAYYGPRFDYDPVTLAPKGLLIEEQRVNYCLYSEDFTQASWAKSNTTVAGNSAVSPSGAVTADTITASAGNGTIRQAIITTAVPFTFSIYLKRKTGAGNVDISMDGTTWVTQTIDAVNWTRCVITQTGVAGTSNPGIRLVASGDEVYAWGAQAE